MYNNVLLCARMMHMFINAYFENSCIVQAKLHVSMPHYHLNSDTYIIIYIYM